MNVKINDYIESQDKQTYITENLSAENPCRIDCGEGINIMNIPETWMEAITDLDPEFIRTYPHTPELKEELIKYWQNHVGLTEDSIFITEGSMDGIRIVSRLFLERGDRVLGNIPTFNAAESEIKLCGAVYDGVQLEPKNNYAFDCDVFSKMLSRQHKMVFIDNPNNPTGQVIPLAEIRKIVEVAGQYGIGVVVDEAYGDYMSKENSAINLLDCCDNVVVLRTFSKGFGLAGLRIGYMLASNGQLARALSKVTDPYSVSALSRLMATTALRDEAFLDLVNQSSKRIKQKIQEQKWTHLSISATDENVPIMLLSHKVLTIDLAGLLARYGIKAISGQEFSSLYKNSVRFRIPREKDLEEVLDTLCKVDRSLEF